jgi:tetrapyrrole methylase family protein/MazG family protein/ATP diphosphatase
MTRTPGDADATPIMRLRRIMAQLRDPQTGCAWDQEQTFDTIAPYTIEEAYEVADAIERGNLGEELRDELGDLLLQVVFHAQMAEETGRFTFDDVADAIADKLVRRHPHVFGDGTARTPDEIKAVWDAIKAEERAGRPEGLLDDVPVHYPPLARAQKLQKRMAKVGFDWDEAADVLAKVREELSELEEARAAHDRARAEAEFGDLLFALVNYARHAGIDAHEALRGTNARFAARVRHMEAALKARGRQPDHGLDLAEWDALWDEAKAAERPARD